MPTSETLTIDGSLGEGGGQILRSSLALSLLTGTKIRIINIRSGRKKPGLLRQHLTCVRAATEIGNAITSGAEIGSKELDFHPAGVEPGAYKFAIGSAGSTSLVLQSILPPLLTASGPSRITLEGGTHNQWAPPFEFLQHVFLPIIERMGAKVTPELERPGFYPAGGGIVHFDIEPCQQLQPIELTERGELRTKVARAQVANLSVDIARRELKVVARKLGWEGDELQVVDIKDSHGPGNMVTVRMAFDHVTELFTGFGAVGKRAEQVAKEAAREARNFLASGATIGAHLADQLLLPMAMAGGGTIDTLLPTKHTTTNIEVIETFLPVRFAIEERGSRVFRIRAG